MWTLFKLKKLLLSFWKAICDSLIFNVFSHIRSVRTWFNAVRKSSLWQFLFLFEMNEKKKKKWVKEWSKNLLWLKECSKNFHMFDLFLSYSKIYFVVCLFVSYFHLFFSMNDNLIWLRKYSVINWSLMSTSLIKNISYKNRFSNVSYVFWQ